MSLVVRRLFLFVLGVLGMWAICGPLSVGAQSTIRIDVENVALEEALDVVRTKTGLDLVYAERLVRDQRVTCSYVGVERRDALDCVLRGTGLQAERVRRHQFVLVSADSGEKRSTPHRVSLSGYVIDAETGERLPGAHVVLSSLGAGTTTNRDGYFVLSSLPPGPYEVQISYLGYQTVDTTLTAGAEPVHVALPRSTVESQGVVVDAGSTDTEQNTSLPGMMSVALEQLDQLPSFGEADLFRGLQWTPGIRKTGVMRGGLSVRGANPDQNLYLLDGAPVYHPWHAFSLISTFQTGSLKNTNFYRGSFPVEHGGRLSAVLDAQMKDGSRRSPTAVAALSALSGRFRIETPVTSNTSFMISGRRSYIDKLIGQTHPVTGPNGRRDTLRTGYYYFDTSAKVAHRASERHRFTLSYYHGRDALDLRLPFNLSLDFQSWLRPADLFFEVDQNWENRVLSGQHQYLPRDDLFLTTTAYYSGYRAQEASFVQPTTTAALTSDYRVRLHDAGVKVDANYHYSVAHELHGGLELSTLRFESTLTSELQRSSGIQQYRQQESQVGAVKVVGYVQENWTPTPRWTLRSGVRASYFSGGNYVNVAPRVSLRYAVHPRWLVLRGNAGLHVQYLHRLRDRHSLAYDLVSSRWVPSSRRVQPAQGAQFGFGIRSQPRSGLTLELDTYARGVRRMLLPADVFQEKDDIEGPGIDVGALLGQYTVGEERAVGTELSVIFDRGAWNYRFAMSTGRTFVRAPGRVQSGLRWRPADLDVPYAFRSAVGWTGTSWRATLATEWRSGYPVSAPTARYRVGDPVEETPETYLYRPQVNNARLSPYFRIDVTVGYTFRLLSADWSAELNLFNALNRSNEVDRTYQPTSTGVDVESQKGLPILPLLELEMRL